MAWINQFYIHISILQKVTLYHKNAKLQGYIVPAYFHTKYAKLSAANSNKLQITSVTTFSIVVYM